MSAEFFHRLVIRASHLEWEEAPEYSTTNLRLRFLAKVTGELVKPTEQVRVADDHLAIVGGGGGQIELEGHFIEIICSGSSPEHAETCTHALLGFVGLCVGESAIGEITFSEAHQGQIGSEDTMVSVRSVHRMPLPIKGNSIIALEAGLGRVAKAVDLQEAVAIALRWYEHGIRATVALDRVLSFFIGIESIIKAHASHHKLKSRLAPLAEDDQVLNMLAQFAESKTRKAAKGLAKQLFVNPSNAERFNSYVKEHRIDTATSDVFRRLATLRNLAVHGEFTSASEGDAEDARTLLRTLVKSELGLRMELFEDKIPFQHGTMVTRAFDQKRVGTPSIDWVKRLGMTTGGKDANSGK